MDNMNSDLNADLRIGAEILRIAVAFDDLVTRGVGDDEARTRLKCNSHLDPKFA